MRDMAPQGVWLPFDLIIEMARPYGFTAETVHEVAEGMASKQYWLRICSPNRFFKWMHVGFLYLGLSDVLLGFGAVHIVKC